jgi:transcriptional regulator with XRE-family HTH domain
MAKHRTLGDNGRTLADLPRLVSDARFLRQLSLRDAAAAIGISPASLSRVETGAEQHVPDLATLTAIAHWLHLEVRLMPRPAVSDTEEEH